MAATPLASSTRFIAPGVTKVLWLPAIAAYPAAPTTTEITAGTDLTGEIAENTGFSSKSDFVETPDLANRFVSKVVGRIKADDSSLGFYADKLATDVRGTLTEGATGFILWMDGGNVSTQKMDMFAVTVGSVSVLRDVAGTNPTKIMVTFALIKVPAYRVTIP